MNMELTSFFDQLSHSPQSIEFSQTMAAIDANYEFTPTEFHNGNVINQAGQNNGSCKIFAFAKHHQLTPEATLACFGQYYRQDVLGNPDGDDHANIRNFMQFGWDGISFETSPLAEKAK